MTSKSWRDVLEIHPAAELFPMMSDDELQALGEDTKKHGLHEGVALCDGKLLDGRNRLEATERGGTKLVVGGKLDWTNIPYRNVKPRDPIAYVISKNIHRRHLSAEQRRDLIAELLKATPEISDRQIADEIKSNRTTVGRIRKKLEESGDVSIVDTRTDCKGRRQWAHKSKPRESIKPVAAGISTSAISATVDQVADAVPVPGPAVIEDLTEAEQPQDPILEICSCVTDAIRRIEPRFWPALIAKLHDELDRMLHKPAQAAE